MFSRKFTFHAERKWFPFAMVKFVLVAEIKDLKSQTNLHFFFILVRSEDNNTYLTAPLTDKYIPTKQTYIWSKPSTSHPRVLSVWSFYISLCPSLWVANQPRDIMSPRCRNTYLAGLPPSFILCLWQSVSLSLHLRIPAYRRESSLPQRDWMHVPACGFHQCVLCVCVCARSVHGRCKADSQRNPDS